MRPLVTGFDNRAGHHWAAPSRKDHRGGHC